MAWMRTTEAVGQLPQLLLRGRFDFSFDGIPLPLRRLSWRRRLNLLACGLDTLRGAARRRGLPPSLQVEPVNRCNLQCPLCPTGAGRMPRPVGRMSQATFQRILDELGDVLLNIVLYCWGEPFLNPDLPDMIAACTARGVRTVTSTNGHCLQTLEEALAVVDAGLGGLVIALDGSTQEVYRSYRQCGHVEKVKNCVRLVEEAKRRRGAARPYTSLRVVVTAANQEDVPNIERFARESGVNMFSYKTVGQLVEGTDYTCYRDTDAVYRRPDAGPDSLRRLRCPFPFRQPTVFWDGTVVGCEFDYGMEASWGNVNTQPFQEIWNSPAAVELRRRILSGAARPGFCSLCPYPGLRGGSTVLSCQELRPLPAAERHRSGTLPLL